MTGAAFRSEPGDGGVPDAEFAAFRSALRRLKREGCTLLVVGDPPREVFTRASESMLGDTDARRWRVFALTDAGPRSAHDRLPDDAAGPRSPSETAKIIDYPFPARQTADRVDSHVSAVPEVTVADEGLDELLTELTDAIAEFGARSHRPAEVRVAVDSLSPLLDSYGVADVRRFVRAVGARVREYEGMAHYLLPEPYDGDRCQRLVTEFDAVVELRKTWSDNAEERWHVPELDSPTPWVPL